jgi:hypothetical protein
LERGEVIESGDEWYTAERGWYKAGCVGSTLLISTPIRRLVNPAVTPAAEPVKPEPVVSVGDRVKVLSGPWAGCTGVVTGFDVEISIVGSTMTAKRDSVPVVRLDHVRVGGSQLIVVSPVEPLAPVVPEVLFRDLSHGETIRQGDEFWLFGHGPWETVGAGSSLIGNTVKQYNSRHRRPVRIQSPGWRYLDAGETVQAGDHYDYANGVGWCVHQMAAGTVSRNDTSFRRKLPTKSGGSS